MTIFVTRTVDKIAIMVYLSAEELLEMNESIMINIYNAVRPQPKKELSIPYG
ncbi:MAG: hypothetical protein JXA42_08500 [Anaerolineales bacterium]|nr:hypothetical protein [Anaerolineales bacterium]